ncbi:MAG: hypothetical protein OXR84_14545 [Magnetovibrio sp.]|nr:hypothetical protein [Magnetovibrio sp.]
MIAWDDSILTGIAGVDADHKAILETINAFIGAVEAGAGAAQVHGAFRRMERCIYRHLEVEEHMLAALGYVGTADHKGAHESLLEELAGI